MAVSDSSSVLVTISISALVAWRLYSRIRRMIGRQKLSRVRPWITVTLLPIVFAGLLFFIRTQPMTALALAVGAAGGVALGIYGLRLTAFEDTPTGTFYTPNAHLGIALSLLLLGRIAYRFIQQFGMTMPARAAPQDFVQSPITLIIFGTLAGYYVTYAIGLLRWRRDPSPGAVQAVAEQPSAP